MAPTKYNRKPIRPTPRAGKGNKRFLWRYYGYSNAILQKNQKRENEKER